MKPQLLSTGLRYFFAVAQTRSLSTAALQLHVTVSAVSRQVTQLEQAFGCELFVRHPRGMELNDAGMRLAAFARTTALEVDRVIDDVRGNASKAGMVVRLACTEGFSNGFIPPLMASFRARHPEAALHLSVASPAEVSRLLRTGEVDVALKYSIEPEPGLATVHKQASPIMALVSPDHLLGKSSQVEISQLLRHALAIPGRGNTVRQAFDLACSARGLEYVPAYTGNAATLLDLTMHGGAVMLSGYLAASHLIRSGALRALRIDDPHLQARSLHVVELQGRTQSAIAAAFVEHLVRGVKGAAGPQRNRVGRAAKTTKQARR